MAKNSLTAESKELLGALIRQKRQSQGWTQQDLAMELRVALTTVSKWEQASTFPGGKSVKENLKKTLGIDVDKMLRSGELRFVPI